MELAAQPHSYGNRNLQLLDYAGHETIGGFAGHTRDYWGLQDMGQIELP